MRIVLHCLKILTIFLIATLGLFPHGPTSAQVDTIVSVSGPGEVNLGEQFTVDIIVEPETAIAGVQFNLAFDSSLVTVDSVAEGNLLSQGGATTYFSAGTIDNIAGTISGVAGAITTPGQTVSTIGTFAEITLTAGMSGGTSLLTLADVLVGDINGQPVQVSVVSGQVAINQPPSLDPIGARSANEGDPLIFIISATDADGDQLVYSTSTLPEGASFDTGTLTFSWTTRYDQAGIYLVNFEVSDGQLTDSENVTITIVQLHEDWDVNGDGNANVLDMVLVGQHWGETGLTGWIQEDTNEDGTVNVLDMIIIGQNWT